MNIVIYHLGLFDSNHVKNKIQRQSYVTGLKLKRY